MLSCAPAKGARKRARSTSASYPAPSRGGQRHRAGGHRLADRSPAPQVAEGDRTFVLDCPPARPLGPKSVAVKAIAAAPGSVDLRAFEQEGRIIRLHASCLAKAWGVAKVRLQAHSIRQTSPRALS